MELETWKKAVNEHIDMLNSLVDDRKSLKKSIEEHLKSCFEWDDIEYNRDFSVITLKWDKDTSPVIYHDKISELGMDWSIHADYDENAFKIIVVEVYPWGVESPQ